MTEQQRPQPYEDGSYTSVDPHLLPPRLGASAERNAAVPATTPASKPVAEASNQGHEGSASRLDEAVARSRNISEDGEIATGSDESYAAFVLPAAGAGAAVTHDETPHVSASQAGGPAHPAVSADGEPDAYGMAYGDKEPAEVAPPNPAPVPATDAERLGVSPTEGLILEPEKRGNRGFALFTSLLATVVFAGLFALLFTVARMIFNDGGDLVDGLLRFIGTAPFYVPVALFGVFLVVWSLIANRAGWWSYILASFLVAFIAAGGYYVGVAFQDVVNGLPWSNQAFLEALTSAEHLPGALLALIAARESALWVAGLAAARGRRVKRKNAQARAEYERKVAEEREYEARRIQSVPED